MKNVFGFNTDSSGSFLDGSEFLYGSMSPKLEIKLREENEKIREKIEKTLSPLKFILLLLFYAVCVCLALFPAEIRSKGGFKALEAVMVLIALSLSAFVILELIALRNNMKKAKLREAKITAEIKEKTGIPKNTRIIHIICPEYSQKGTKLVTDTGEIFISPGRVNIYYCERVYSFPLNALKKPPEAFSALEVSYVSPDIMPDRKKCSEYGIQKKGRNRSIMTPYRLTVKGVQEEYEILLPSYEGEAFENLKKQCEMLSSSPVPGEMIYL